MKKLKIFRLSILAFLFLMLFAGTSSDTPNVIYWSEDNPLEWDDFKGEARFDFANRYISALTTSGIIHYRGCKEGKIIYKIKPYFQKDESWVKSEARTTYHLDHEQLHFDVTELHARKLRKLLAEQNFRCGEEEAFEKYIEQYLNNWEMMQRSYDINTHHSTDENKQMEWKYRIQYELSLLEDFKSQ